MAQQRFIDAAEKAKIELSSSSLQTTISSAVHRHGKNGPISLGRQAHAGEIPGSHPQSA
jgi:molecular chaperone DnaK (HSP70)